MADQQPLWPSRPALGRDAFFVTEANRLALTQIDGTATWPQGKLLLIGPHGAGKTHLAHVWAEAQGARIVSARGLCAEQVPDLVCQPVCLEDLDRIAGDPDRQNAAFHLHNLCQAQGQPLLLTGTGEPGTWGLTLPDLASRIQATPLARLSEPDDALLAAVLAKMFHDHLTVPAPNVIPYLLTHMPRSFAMARRVVQDIDRRALGTPKGVTRAKAAEVLARLAQEGALGAD